MCSSFGTSAKNRQNLRKHGLDFADAHCLFEGPLLAAADVRQDYGEDRYLGIGTVEGRVAVIVFAEPAPDVIRVISLRKATRSERLQYEGAMLRQGNKGAEG